MGVLAVLLAGLCGVSLAQSALAFKRLSEIRALVDTDSPVPPEWPPVSAIVPTRDEGACLEAALRTRLDDGYPALELVVVDDRSLDDTPAIVARLSAADPRVVPVRVEELPDGWLGKLHAMDIGTRHATGEWLLFSDADIHMEPGTLAKAVAFCQSEGRDFVALVPEFRSRSPLVNVCWSVFMRVLATSLSAAGVRDPRSKASAGSGSFMLARRSLFDATPGFEYLRMETGDDMALGAMMKRAGARCEFMNGRGAAWLPSYGSYAELVRGIEKNGATLLAVPTWALGLGLAVAALVEFASVIALVAGLEMGVPWLVVLALVTLAAFTLANVAALWVNMRRVSYALLWPIGWPLMAYAVGRSAWLAKRRGGVQWRGTFYSAEELAEGRRFGLEDLKD